MVFKSLFASIKDKVLVSSQHDEPEEHLEYLISLGVLLWIVAEADDKFMAHEEAQIKKTLREYGDVSEKDFPIVQRAIEEANTVRVDVHHFTRDIKKELDREEKLRILDSLFRVACSDKDLHEAEHEEIRRISNLLGLDHSEFIASKIKIKKEFGLDTVDL